MRCRFCDTEIADKALICYRCGRATSDPRVAPPVARAHPWTAVLGLAAAGAAVAAALPSLLDGAVLWGGWAGTAAVVAGAVVGVWRRWARRR